MSSEPIIQAKDVEKYLSNNLDFFNYYPELSSNIKVIHPKSGNEISLLEKQLFNLRTQKDDLISEIEIFKNIAEQNSQIFNKVHGLTKALVMTKEQQAVDVIYKHMSEVFYVDYVTLFSWEIPKKPLNGLHQLGMSANWLNLLKDKLNSKKIMCGSLEREWRKGLFPKISSSINSTCIIPLGVNKNWGVMALGSYDKRFDSDKETYFLQILGELISAKFNTLF